MTHIEAQYGIDETADEQRRRHELFTDSVNALQKICWICIAWLTAVFCYLEFVA